MENRAYYEPIINEKISKIPDSLLPDFVRMIDVFQDISNKSTMNKDNLSKKNLLSFAGAWSDYDEAENMIEDIYERRSKYFINKENR